jgi:hypothetical protein
LGEEDQDVQSFLIYLIPPDGKKRYNIGETKGTEAKR